jgi:predicted phosphodiesterase
MIYFLGDVHGRLDHVLPAIGRRGDEQANVVFLGDIEAGRPFEEEIRPLTEAGVGVWFVHGNHDTDSQAIWDNLQGSWHRCLDGRVVDIEGVRVAGLGGIFRGEVWYPDGVAAANQQSSVRSYEEYLARLKATTPPRLRDSARVTGKALKHLSTIFPEIYDRLAGEKADVLVVHEAPSCHPHGFPAIDLLVQVMGVKIVFHGHHHDSRDYSAWEAKMGFRSHGVGFRGITSLLGERVVAGDYDGQRC